MNVPKLHHYLAEAYLKRFTDENGDLWVLDRRTADIRRQRPEVTAAERELYTLDLPEAPDRRVETLLAETVDGPGLRVIGAIAGGGELEEADRAPLAAFVAGLLLRTPSFREQHRQFGEQMRGALRGWGVEPLEMDAGLDARPSEPGGVRTDVLLSFIEEARNTRRPYQNEFVSMMLGLLPLITQTILTMDWVIAKAPPKKTFVTSDSPVVIGRPQGQSPLLGVGLSTLGAEKVIPLTSGIALLIRDMTDTPRVRYGMIDRDRIRRVNEVLVRQSERFSMAHSAPLLESIRRHTNLEPAPPLRVQMGGGPTSEGTPK